MVRKLKSMDGNTAAAHVSYAFTEVAAIYPITPSSPMAGLRGSVVCRGSEECVRHHRQGCGACSPKPAPPAAVHGSLNAGALTTTYTASQGLLLMIPNMYKIAGELLPCVFHVSARAVATHALNIFGDHSDVYGLPSDRLRHAVRRPTFRRSWTSPRWRTCPPSRAAFPFINFFDGFRTSHEIQKVAVWDYDDLADMLRHGMP